MKHLVIIATTIMLTAVQAQACPQTGTYRITTPSGQTQGYVTPTSPGSSTYRITTPSGQTTGYVRSVK